MFLTLIECSRTSGYNANAVFISIKEESKVEASNTAETEILSLIIHRNRI